MKINTKVRGGLRGCGGGTPDIQSLRALMLANALRASAASSTANWEKTMKIKSKVRGGIIRGCGPIDI